MSDFGAGPDGSAGSLLRAAREAAGLHLDALAATLKVPPRKLEALEQDRYDLLPDAVFVRALASSVCRTLKLDPQPVLSRLPQTPQPRLKQDRDGINAPFRPRGQTPKAGRGSSQVSRATALIVLLLLVGAAVLVFLPVAQREGAPAAARPVGTAAAPAAPAAPAPLLQAPAAVAAPPAAAAAGTAASAPLPTASAVGPAPGAAAMALVADPSRADPAGAAASAAAAAASEAASAPAAAAPGGVVAFRTSGESWIQVRDATGATVLQRLMGPGDTASAGGTLPLTVTVGNSATTRVMVRGRPYDLGAVSRDNVARFEVK